MKKFNLFKKIGVCALSLATALSIGGACLTANVSAATHTPNYSVTAKDDAYLEGLFVAGAGTTVEASYNAPEYMKVATEYSNGVALTFDGTGGSVKTKNAYKVSDLINGITFVPILKNSNGLQGSADIGELEIIFYEEAVEGTTPYVKNKITVRINSNGGGNGWDKQGWSAVTAGSETLSGPNAMPKSQILAGYTVSTATALTNTKYEGKVMLRKEKVGARLNVGMSGNTSGTVPFKFGYIEYKEAYKDYVDDDNDASTPAVEQDLERNNAAIITAHHLDHAKLDAQIGTMANVVKSDRSGAPYPAGSFTGMHFIRRLGTTDYQADSDIGGSLLTGDEVVFEGFSANAEVKMEIKALSGSGTILISNLCGESLKSEVRVANAYNGYVGVNYTIPTPKFYLNNPAGDAFTGTITVKDAAGNAIPEANKISDYVYKFTTAGKYVATFTQTSGSETYGGSYESEILPADAETVAASITKKITPAQCIVGMSVNVGASVSSPIYVKDDLSRVELTIISPSGKEEFTNIGANHIYTFNEEGTYLLKYYAIDHVFTALPADRDDDGDITNNKPLVKETVVTCNVKRNYFALEIPESSRYALGDDVNDLVVNKDIVTFFDGAYGRNFYEDATSYAFEVKAPGSSNYVQITPEEFENGYNFASGVFDDYNFRIQINYSVGGNNYTIPAVGEYLEFTVTVVDGMQPIIYGSTEEVLFGGTLVSEQGQLYTYNATVGTTVGFSKFYAYDLVGEDADGDLTENITLSLTKKSSKISKNLRIFLVSN